MKRCPQEQHQHAEGGEDFDQRVMQHFMKIFQKKSGKDMSSDKRAIQKLRRERSMLHARWWSFSSVGWQGREDKASSQLYSPSPT
eukprot:3178685-Amphidinium_carterae.1